MQKYKCPPPVGGQNSVIAHSYESLSKTEQKHNYQKFCSKNFVLQYFFTIHIPDVPGKKGSALMKKSRRQSLKQKLTVALPYVNVAR